MKMHDSKDAFAAARRLMVELQIEARGVQDERVLQAMRAVPRHRFVPHALQDEAHADHPLPIGRGQTISQPYIVGYMAEMLRLHGYERVLEVGSGSGYMAAVLSLLVKDVYAVELEPDLCTHAEERLRSLDCDNVHFLCGDGSKGWPEKSPFDAILLSCSAEVVPPALIEQLAPDGRMVLPLGPRGWTQQLVHITKTEKGIVLRKDLPVAFVPLRNP